MPIAPLGGTAAAGARILSRIHVRGNPFPRLNSPANLPHMPRYRANEDAPYFCTITVLDWLPVLIESRYIDPILDSLRFCQQHKNLRLFAFVIMPNHIHLIASHPNPRRKSAAGAIPPHHDSGMASAVHVAPL